MKAQTFTSVWEALENTRAEAISMKVRSEIMIALRQVIEDMAVTQGEAAKKLGITQPRLNDLMRGRIHRFSLDALFDLATRAGLIIHLELKAA